ncbi:MAG: NAD(P)H-dependent oxidoreductase [Alphaproteobacteria bacterium]|nr:NAD(P)H-dependent oxidoreductase [Alphaproteobacteria bacterium]
MPVLLGISGSLRAKATNRMLIREAGRHFGGEYVEADIRFPLYDGDEEAASGVPAPVQTLADQIKSAEAVVVSTPEYNQSFSGSLKNALDWISRVDGRPWADKPVALMSAAAGRAGGARANYALRLAMTSFRARLLPLEVLLAGSGKAFDENGRLVSERVDGQVADLMAALKAGIERGR